MRTVIVGASMAGLRVAEGLRRNGYDSEIVVFGNESRMPYNRPPLSKDLLTSDAGFEAVEFAIKPDCSDISWRVGEPIVSASLDEKLVIDSEGGRHQFDKLVIATGVRPRSRADLGSAAANSFVLRTFDDAFFLRAQLQRNSKVIIQGGGFIGCELAAAAVSLGCDVTLITRSESILRAQLGELLGSEVQRRHIEMGVQVLNSVEVSKVFIADHPTPTIRSVKLSDGSVLDCDVLVQATGSLPNTEWLEGNGLELSDGVLCNEKLQVMRVDGQVDEDVFAVGDIARFPNQIFDSVHRRVEHWNTANETARFAARRICSDLFGSESDDSFHLIPSFWSDQSEIKLFGIGQPSLADQVELVQGEISNEAVVVYLRSGVLVGACGLGLRGPVQALREKLGKRY